MFRIIVFVGIVTLVYLGLHYFLAFWVIRHFDLPVSNKTIRVVFLILALCFPVSAILVRTYPGNLTQLFSFFCYVWMGIIFIWFCSTFAVTVIEVAIKITKPSLYNKTFVGYSVFILTFLAITLSIINGVRVPEIKRIEIPMANLPQKLDGFSIAVLSDMHLSHLVPFKRFERVVNKVKKQNPDMLVHLGDFAEAGFDYHKKVYDATKTITPPHGKFAVMGNHEFYYGIKTSQGVFKNSTFTVLRQKVASLDCGLQILGIDDIKTAGIGDRQIEELFSKTNPNKPVIVLTHQPLKFNLFAKHKASLVLSGHTHAGQIFPFNWFAKTMYPHIYGLHKKQNTYFYITSGTFFWGPPMR
ncbi:MAG TPA: metallophosphoesterase, partial [Elusimicrobiales bacterium]|nr:metallophosphoesterase [Elusimicrobiales bacterium]